MGFAWDILAPGNITRVMQQTQDALTLPMPLMWYDRAAKVNASDDELTLRDKHYVYAADIIAADSPALVRDAGEFKFDRHEIAKLKHGFAISESMVKTIRRIEAGSLSDEQTERLGLTLMKQAQEIERLRKEFGLEDEDLNLDLGPLGKLL